MFREIDGPHLAATFERHACYTGPVSGIMCNRNMGMRRYVLVELVECSVKHVGLLLVEIGW